MKEIRIAVLGNVDSGKTTLISSLSNKILDNGRGYARSRIFKHKHEIDTGRTSSIAYNYLHIDKNKYITFIDLAGHEKYYKTTIYGINSGLVDYAILLIGSNMGILRMTKEHLGVIKALNIPFFVVFTKIDICPPNVLERNMNEMKKLIVKNFKKYTYDFNNYQDYNSKLIKIFTLSNVSGKGLNEFRNFISNLNNLQIKINNSILKDKDKIFWIDECFIVKGIGLVLSGIMKKGKLKINDKLLLGPINNKFIEIQIKSIHDNFRKHIDYLSPNISGCLNIKVLNKETLVRKDIKKGMVILNKDINKKVSYSFRADIVILQHPTTIKLNYEPVIHCGKITQSAKIIKMTKEQLRMGDKDIITFKFKYKPEFIEIDDAIIFREGKTKGIGKIIEIL